MVSIPIRMVRWGRGSVSLPTLSLGLGRGKLNTVVIRRLLHVTVTNLSKQREGGDWQEGLTGKVKFRVTEGERKVAAVRSEEKEGGEVVPTRELDRPTRPQLQFRWEERPRTVLMIKKPNDPPSDPAFVEICHWLRTEYELEIIVEPHLPSNFLKQQLPFVRVFSNAEIPILREVVDFIVTLGGDGSILHVSSLFNTRVPPMISFSMGRLGFLLPFHIKHYRKELTRLIEGEVTLMRRNRLSCKLLHRGSVTWGGELTDTISVANEVNVHRGTFPHLTSIDCYVDDLFLTNGIADGLIVATPTGSTAYSLSAGGPILHPAIEGLLLTPICPRSLSFRPVLLPASSTLTLSLNRSSRSPAQLSLDGREVSDLQCGDAIEVTQSPYPLLSVNRQGGGEDWTRDINQLLKWNQNFAPFPPPVDGSPHDN